jgi:hypothetical protein
MRTMRLWLLDTLGMRALTILDDEPRLGHADTCGGAVTTLHIEGTALPYVLFVCFFGPSGGCKEADEDSEDGNVHRGVVDRSGVNVDFVVVG